MARTDFLDALVGMFSFLTDIMNWFIETFSAYPWLFSLVIAPTIVALIVFGVSIAFELVSSQFDNGKGER